MKYSAGIAAMVFAASAAVAAQQTTTTTPAPAASSPAPSQAARPAQGDAQRSVTVTGCLKPIEAPGSVAATTASNSQFMLTGARVMPPGSGGATATTPPAAPAAAGAASFAVVAENVEELRGQANHQVEIIGRLEPMPAGAASAPVGTTGTSSAAPSMRLRVDTVKQLAAGCPQ